MADTWRSTDTTIESKPHADIHPTNLVPPAVLRALLIPRQQELKRDLARDRRVSWLFVLLYVSSYMLMLTDVPRTGLGLRNLSAYTLLEPDQFILFGPYAYPVTEQLLKNDTARARAPFWPYKYDSTSVAMRAVAKHLAIREWPACVTYDAMCDESAGIAPAALFNMIDSLIDRVKTYRSFNGHPGRLMLRTRHDWYDRLQSYAFPWFFSNGKLRTVQAIHYEGGQLSASISGGSLCGLSSQVNRPLTCGQSWTNFGRLCSSSKSLCHDIGHVHAHVPARLHQLLAKYPDNHTMDFVLLEGVDDLTRSSLTYQGYKNIDVVALARVRKCSTSSLAQCETILVDDFRYEVVPLMTNVGNWFWVTGIIRSAGQLYAWMRLVLLLAGCYYATRSSVLQPSFFGRAMLTVRTLFLLPSQVVVYGSLFPIACYLLAHLIDSAAVYEIMGLHFSTLMGVISLDIEELLRVCAVSMRSLWLLAFACHLVQRLSTRCAWSPIHGVPGVPEFSLSFVASLTILAQVRYPALRNSRVLTVYEVAPCTLSNTDANSSHGLMSMLLFGTMVDYKCLAVSVCLHIGVVLLCRLLNFVIPRWFKYQYVLFTRTTVPYSASSLWTTSAFVVSWNGAFLVTPQAETADKTLPLCVGLQPVVSDGKLTVTNHRVIAVQPAMPHPVVKSASPEFSATFPRSVTRNHDTETLIFLMNLAVMTDPLAYLRLRVFRGHRIGVYTESRPRAQLSPHGSSRSSRRTLLLPLTLATALVDIPIDWSKLELQVVVHTSDLDWCDLLQCD